MRFMNILSSEAQISKIFEYANLRNLILLSREAFPTILQLFSIQLLPRCQVMQLLDLRSSLLLLVPVDPPPMALLDPRHSARQLLGHHFRLAMSLLSLKTLHQLWTC